MNNKTGTEYIKINYDKIKEHLTEQERLDPEKTWGPLDFLRSGIEHNLLNILSSKGSDSGVVELNHDDRTVTMLGDSIIQGDVEFIGPKNELSQDEKLYEFFEDIFEYARAMELEAEFFEKIEGRNKKA